uniref:Uncharacterized protein n=1 Tax=Physcomitrium patens TaxID=3218 RepID=A0A2K1K270_PHYPA|nr:hypothetical protein PHYPA_012348 [Physcomitrium patens]
MLLLESSLAIETRSSYKMDIHFISFNFININLSIELEAYNSILNKDILPMVALVHLISINNTN